MSIGLAWLGSHTDAYGIDSSCKDPDFIERAADAALDMAAKASAALQPAGGAQLDPNIDRLVDLLFRGPFPTDARSDRTLIEKIVDVFDDVVQIGPRADLARIGNELDDANQVVRAVVSFN